MIIMLLLIRTIIRKITGTISMQRLGMAGYIYLTSLEVSNCRPFFGHSRYCTYITEGVESLSCVRLLRLDCEDQRTGDSRFMIIIIVILNGKKWNRRRKASQTLVSLSSVCAMSRSATNKEFVYCIIIESRVAS